MSRAVLLNLPEHGHMNPTYPMAAELVRRGDHLVYFSTDPFQNLVEAAGAKFHRIGPGELFAPPAHVGGLYSVMAYSISVAEKILSDVLEAIREHNPDYLLIDAMCVWGRLAQQVLGIPCVTLAPTFCTNPRFQNAADMVAIAYGRVPKAVLLNGIEALNTYMDISREIDQKYGTSSPDIVEFFSNRHSINIVFTSLEFHINSELFDDQYKFVGPSISDRFDAFDDFPYSELDGEKVIFVSLGTIFNDRPEFFRACYEAFAGSDYKVVVAIGRNIAPSDLGEKPDNFIVREFVPQLKVLEKTTVFVTHAGMNSTSEALWYGVPLLVFPQHGDQHIVAGQVVEKGAGLMMTPADVIGERIKELVEEIVDNPSFKDAALELGESFREAGGVVRAADAIDKFKTVSGLRVKRNRKGDEGV